MKTQNNFYSTYQSLKFSAPLAGSAEGFPCRAIWQWRLVTAPFGKPRNTSAFGKALNRLPQPLFKLKAT